MLTNAILGGHTNVVPINNGKKSSRTVKKEYKESTYDRLKRERDDRLKGKREVIKRDYNAGTEGWNKWSRNDNFPF